MKITALHSLPRLHALLQLMLLLVLTPLLPIHEAVALAPQDSTHLASTFQSLPDERFIFPKVINNRIWYRTNNGLIRARDFNGAVVSEHLAPGAADLSWLDVSSDGRQYYFIQTVPYGRRVRIAIVAPDGTPLGDFGPEGKGKGEFGSYDHEDLAIRFAVSPVTGKVYVSAEYEGDALNPANKGRVLVFDRDGNFLHKFRTNGIIAPSLEGKTQKILVRGDADGQDELFIYDNKLKVFSGNGQFRKLIAGNDYFGLLGNAFTRAFFWNNLLVISTSEYSDDCYVFPASISDSSEVISSLSLNRYPYARADFVIGFNNSGGLITAGGTISSGNTSRLALGFGSISQYSYPNFSNFDAVTRNAVPNPWVLGVSQRPGGGIVDIDYQVDDANDSAVTTALVAFAGGVASLSNVLPMNTIIEGTGTRVGANQPTGAVQRLTWNAGSDWNVDFGTLRVMALARDSRSHWFDVHLVEIPADGDRPAVTISRNPLLESDFLTQFLWLVAKKDPSVKLIDGVLFGTTGADDGVILANGTSSTPAGREFLLKRDGLRLATSAEVVRAREGATPGFEVKLAPPLQMARPTGTFPKNINEFGVESGDVTNPVSWYVVRATAG